MADSICWSCRKCYGGCLWSGRFIPVVGWIAIRQDIPADEKLVESYFVIHCPEYSKDPPRKKARNKWRKSGHYVGAVQTLAAGAVGAEILHR